MCSSPLGLSSMSSLHCPQWRGLAKRALPWSHLITFSIGPLSNSKSWRRLILKENGRKSKEDGLCRALVETGMCIQKVNLWILTCSSLIACFYCYIVMRESAFQSGSVRVRLSLCSRFKISLTSREHVISKSNVEVSNRINKTDQPIRKMSESCFLASRKVANTYQKVQKSWKSVYLTFKSC